MVRQRQKEPFRMIVACVDFSENARRAALRAAEVACQDGAQLELLTVYQVPIIAAAEPGGLGPIFPPYDSDEIIKEIQAKINEFAAEVAEHGGGLEVRTKVIQKIGISTGIVERLLEVEADLVVLGTPGPHRP